MIVCQSIFLLLIHMFYHFVNVGFLLAIVFSLFRKILL